MDIASRNLAVPDMSVSVVTLPLWESHLAPRLLAEDLLSCNPTVLVDQSDPVFKYLKTDRISGGLSYQRWTTQGTELTLGRYPTPQ